MFVSGSHDFLLNINENFIVVRSFRESIFDYIRAFAYVVNIIPMSSVGPGPALLHLVHESVIQSSVVIKGSNIVRYYINDYRNWGRISIRCWIDKRHPIPRLTGELWGCLLWTFVRQLTVVYNSTAVYLNISSYADLYWFEQTVELPLKWDVLASCEVTVMCW